MVEAITRESKARGDIREFEIGQFFDDLRRAEPRREKVEHIRDSNPHPSDTGATAALARIDGNPICDFNHGRRV